MLHVSSDARFMFLPFVSGVRYVPFWSLHFLICKWRYSDIKISGLFRVKSPAKAPVPSQCGGPFFLTVSEGISVWPTFSIQSHNNLPVYSAVWFKLVYPCQSYLFLGCERWAPVRIKGEPLAYTEHLGKSYTTKGGSSGAEVASSGLMGVRRPGLYDLETNSPHDPSQPHFILPKGWQCPSHGVCWEDQIEAIKWKHDHVLLVHFVYSEKQRPASMENIFWVKHLVKHSACTGLLWPYIILWHECS